MAITRQRRPTPPREELKRLVGRRQTLGTLIDFADAMSADEVAPTLRLICSLIPVDGGIPEGEELRLWALFGALVSRYLFSISELPQERDWPL